MTHLRKRYLEDLSLRNYSARTLETYCDCVRRFAEYFRMSPELLGPEHIRQYLLFLLNEKKSSWAWYNQTVCALRFLYSVTLKKDWAVERIPFGRKTSTLPVVLSIEEVSRLLDAVKHPIYKTILSTIYSSGIRVSEACNLQASDIDSHRMLIRIRQGKGKKDRYVILSERVLALLRNHWKQYRPALWLFEGSAPDRHVEIESVQRACAQARKAAGIQKKATPHTLRHCFATHLLEQGSNIRVIQILMGHKSLGTTSKYLHVSPTVIAATTSPFDSLPVQE